MGFTTGFTGGVTLTLSIAYLTVLAHQRNRQRQSDILRANAYVLNSLADGGGALANPALLAGPAPPTHEELAARDRTRFVQAAKDRWNEEVEGAVHWAQTKDWAGVREDAEAGAARLWRSVFGEPAGETASRVGGEVGAQVKQTAESARATAGEKAGGVAAAAREALENARARSVASEHKAQETVKEAWENAKTRGAAAEGRVQQSVKDAWEDAKARGVAAETRALDAAREAKEASTGALQRGIQKGKDIVGRARAAVGIAEEKLESQAEARLLHMSDVEKALQQRYTGEAAEEAMQKSVSELLSERYQPIDQRDNTKLRGV
ncbi:MICOS complex subunit MIC12 [Pleurostoma richardsiae]|uniref:MICOS complex subunit MIC12 n=1 Tax=Pleurostoma richardsiae TaxID=41990 RepID=A0AA38R9N0_9PEZI|nr:MICOS complex subunit MIC12 [Pleurostoma richardsiae]